jgi:hypothetical protein
MLVSLESLTSATAHVARSTTLAQQLPSSANAAQYEGAVPFFLFCSRTRFYQGDMDLMAAGYAPDARIFGMDGEVLAAGRDEIRALFSDAYERNPTLHYEIQTRIEVGPFVIDEEPPRRRRQRPRRSSCRTTSTAA